MTASTTAVLLTCLLFYFIVSKQFEDNYRTSLNNLATIIGENCKVALLFDIPEDANTILRSLQSQKSIHSVELYDESEDLFAVYQNNSQKHNSFNASAQLRIEKTILLEDDSYAGRLVIIDDMRGIQHTRKIGLFILIAVAAVAICISFFLTSFLRNVVSQPLDDLTSAAKKLAKGDFSVLDNIKVNTLDEIGTLSSSFIEMGHNLQTSRRTLEEYNRTLEQRVTNRTSQLNKTVENLKESQAQLIHSEKMAALGVMVAGVAHDINNNINFISSIIPAVGILTRQLLEEKPDDPTGESNNSTPQELHKEILTLLESAEEGVRRTCRIINDMNTFCQPGTGEFIPVNIHDELEKILRFLQFEFKHRISVINDFAAHLPLVSCLPDQLNQVYTNVLLNASHAIKSNGTIHIKTWLDDQFVNIRFRDNGIGINPDIIGNVFDPFFTTKEVGEGIGLGMSVSYSIIKNHHGEIQIKSQLGIGTDVILQLPRSGGIL